VLGYGEVRMRGVVSPISNLAGGGRSVSPFGQSSNEMKSEADAQNVAIGYHTHHLHQELDVTVTRIKKGLNSHNQPQRKGFDYKMYTYKCNIKMEIQS